MMKEIKDTIQNSSAVIIVPTNTNLSAPRLVEPVVSSSEPPKAPPSPALELCSSIPPIITIASII